MSDQSLLYFDHQPLAGDNFKTAQFSCWTPPDMPIRAVVVLCHGSNSDGRQMVRSRKWQSFALKHNLALVGCFFEDKEPSWVEQYIQADQGSGAALISALESFQLGAQKLLLWGFSAGGEFAYEFSCWRPDKVAAFIINKGGVYMTLLASEATRQIPAYLFYGTRDSQWRQDVIKGIYGLNSMAGAAWELVPEPVAHTIGQSEELSMELFEEALR